METVKKNRGYFIVLAIALICTIVQIVLVAVAPSAECAFGSDTLHYNSDEQVYSTNPISLSKGIYEISIDYDSTNGGYTNVYCDIHSHNTLRSDNPALSAYENHKSFNIWLNDDVSDLTVELRADGGTLLVKSVKVATAWNSKLYLVTVRILFLILIAGILLAVKFRDQYKENGVRIVVLGLICVLSSWGVFIRYLLPGHDMVFHMLRIEGLKDALMMFDIPSQVQTNWNFGYGYAVSAMYPDITLLLPALMRILGFTIQTSYKTYIVIINIATTLCAYFCFKKISKKDLSALMGTFLYVCAPYRLACIYNRAAVGEYTAMLFIPLILLTFYYAYFEDDSLPDYGKRILLPVIGFSGLLQSHLLSCIMAAMFIAAYCIVNWRKTFSRNRLIYLLKIAGLTILVNLWFLVPFIRFMKEPLVINAVEEMAPDLQSYGLTIPELFAQYPSGHFWFNFAFLNSLSERNTLAFGNGISVLLIVYLVLLPGNRLGRKTKKISVMAIFTLVSLWLASNLFPYSKINQISPTVANVLTKVQFPYRYLVVAIVFGSLFSIFFYDKLIKKCNKNLVMIITASVLLISASQSLNYMHSLFYNGTCATNYDSASLYSAEVIGAQYLYQGTALNRCEKEQDIISEDVDVYLYVRSKNRFEINCITGAQDGKIILPIFAYPGYVATTEDGTKLEITREDNNRLAVLIPGNFNGTILVKYKQSIVWRVFELISILAFIYVVYLNSCGRSIGNDEQIQ